MLRLASVELDLGLAYVAWLFDWDDLTIISVTMKGVTSSMLRYLDKIRLKCRLVTEIGQMENIKKFRQLRKDFKVEKHVHSHRIGLYIYR